MRGLPLTGRMRGDLKDAGQELQHLHSSMVEWREKQHDVDGNHTTVVCETLDVEGETRFGGPWLVPDSAIISPPQVTADKNDYEPPAFGEAIVLRVSTDAARTITGFKTHPNKGRWMLLLNIGNFDVTLAHNDTASVAYYRIGCPLATDVVLGSGSSAVLFYDPRGGQWDVVSATGDVSGASSVGVGGAPDSAQYITAASNGDLTAERVATDTTSITWDFGTAAQAKANVVTSIRTRTLGITIDGGGAAITTGIKGDLQVPVACTITAARMFADQSGSAVVDIWKDTYANFPPTDADSITSATPPTLSGAKSEDVSLSSWTTAIAAGDILRFNVDSAATITRLQLQLTVTVP